MAPGTAMAPMNTCFVVIPWGHILNPLIAPVCVSKCTSVDTERMKRGASQMYRPDVTAAPKNMSDRGLLPPVNTPLGHELKLVAFSSSVTFALGSVSLVLMRTMADAVEGMSQITVSFGVSFTQPEKPPSAFRLKLEIVAEVFATSSNCSIAISVSFC